MDRAEATGLGVALAGHGALLAALSLGLAGARLPPPRNQPIEVSFVEDVGLVSTAPVPSPAPPAPSIAPEIGTPEEAAPQRVVTPAPSPPAPQPAPKIAQTKAAPARKADTTARGSRFGADFLKGLGRDPSPSRSQAPPAAVAGPAVQASLGAEVRRQLKPHWRAPTGADAEQLRTILEVQLARDGSLVGEPRLVEQTGVTAGNRSQAGLHRERAIRAVKLAAPFKLPAEYYDAWKVIRPAFDRRLSQ
jgi:TonB-like protein